MVRLNHHLRQNYSIFMSNFKQKQHKLSNNHVQFSNRNLLCKFEPPSKTSWIRPCFYHLFYFIYMGQPIWDPYRTRLHCPYGCPYGSWVPYRLLAGLDPWKKLDPRPWKKLDPWNLGKFDKTIGPLWKM